MTDASQNAEIMDLVNQVYQNLSMSPVPTGTGHFAQIDPFFQIFNTLFPIFSTQFSKIHSNEYLTPSEKLQKLIQILANDVLQMRLNHISGRDILSGERKPLLHLFQILEAISQSFLREKQKIMTPNLQASSNNSTAFTSCKLRDSSLQVQPEYQQSMVEYIAEQMHNIRQKLAKLKKDSAAKAACQNDLSEISKHEQQYHYFLRQYLKQSAQSSTEYRSQLKLKNQEKKAKKMLRDMYEQKQSIEMEKLSYQLKRADEQYLARKRIYQLIFNQEKQKIIEDNKKIACTRKQRQKEVEDLVDSVQNFYKNKIQQKKEELETKRWVHEQQRKEEKALSQLREKELRSARNHQISLLQSQWKQEQQKLLLQNDITEIEQQIIDIYKKI